MQQLSPQAVTLRGVGETIRRRGLERGGYIIESRSWKRRSGDQDPGPSFAFLFVFWTSWGEKPFSITIFHSYPGILSFSKVTESSDQSWNLWNHELQREFAHTCGASASRTEPSPRPLPQIWTTAQEYCNVWTLQVPFNYISCNTYLGVIVHDKHLHTLLIVHYFQMYGFSFLEIVFFFISDSSFFFPFHHVSFRKTSGMHAY